MFVHKNVSSVPGHHQSSKDEIATILFLLNEGGFFWQKNGINVTLLEISEKNINIETRNYILTDIDSCSES